MPIPAARGLSAYPVELPTPDIERYRAGNTDVPFFQCWESGVPGPRVMITGLVHGNELCGAIALDRLHRSDIRPRRGSLTVGFANVAAYGAFDPSYPTLSRFIDEDLNRLWDLDTLHGKRSSLELARARAIRPLVDRTDFLLDIHSMQNATEPLLLAGLTEPGVALARKVGFPETVVIDGGHASGARLRDYGAFADPKGPCAALLVECGQHWEARSAPVAFETSLRFLAATGIVDFEDVSDHLESSPKRQRFIRVTEAVTVLTQDFAFNQTFRGKEVIPKAGTVLGHDGDRAVKTPFDNCVLIMPSGRLAPGQTAVRFGQIHYG
ncbi:MAG: succinylglutamate desuccinylase/aspartoacylase family protein [Alphaproteobacteria bacterium]|nr:succinylglutamate desuccinylase/aspartoacylase family protein [Alphaproteobacteria bacterium]